jgi:hypothetical protein
VSKIEKVAIGGLAIAALASLVFLFTQFPVQREERRTDFMRDCQNSGRSHDECVYQWRWVAGEIRK